MFVSFFLIASPQCPHGWPSLAGGSAFVVGEALGYGTHGVVVTDFLNATRVAKIYWEDIS